MSFYKQSNKVFSNQNKVFFYCCQNILVKPVVYPKVPFRGFSELEKKVML